MTAAGSRHVTVLGAGPVGLTAARILVDCGWSVRLIRTGRSRSRPIALPARTVEILENLWGCELTRLCWLHRLSARRVAWAAGEANSEVGVTAFSLDVAVLSDALEACLPGAVTVEQADDRSTSPCPEGFTIDASGTPALDSCRIVTGRRTIHLWPDLPADPGLTDHTEIVAGPGFWVFLLPLRSDRVSIQVATPGGEVDTDAVVHRLAQEADGTLARFLADCMEGWTPGPDARAGIAPRLGCIPGSPARLTVGDRAMTFDPVCGDGMGQGLRSAILAAAALNALADGQPGPAVLRHVADRHAFAFASHLKHCAHYYRTIADAEPWRREIAETLGGLRSVLVLRQSGGERFRLRYNASCRDRGPHMDAIRSEFQGPADG